jgi:cytochrome c553
MVLPRLYIFSSLLVCLAMLSGCNREASEKLAGHEAAAQPAVVEEPEQIQVCAECHRKAGRTSAPFWPKLQGKSRAELVTLLRAYRDERLTNTKMNKVAHSLSDEDINQLADFYAR